MHREVYLSRIFEYTAELTVVIAYLLLDLVFRPALLCVLFGKEAELVGLMTMADPADQRGHLIVHTRV
jgi:hypothetical protein